MIGEFFNNIFKQRFYVMFLTCFIYILGLIGFFNNCSVVLFGCLILVLSILLLKNYISSKLVFVWIFVFLFAFFNASLRIKNTDELCKLAPLNDVLISGQVASIPDTSLESKTRFFFNVNKLILKDDARDIDTKTFVTIQGKHDLNIGDFYELKGKLRTPFEVSNPSQFDYAKYIRNFGTYTTFFADKVSKADGTLNCKWKILQVLNNMRRRIISYHAHNIKSPNIEILGGVVFGDDAVSPPDNIKKSFINAGILHILAASGMNVALIYGIFFFIFRHIRVPYKINIFLGMLIVILYTFMTGMGASVIRASVILLFILIGKLIDRDAHSISLLSFVALLMLIFNPAYINDVGFQLSFIVTFGLLVMANPIFTKFERVPPWLLSSIFIPIIAQLWVAPIQMFYFNTFSLYSVFANIAIMPFITVISFGGFISSVLALISPIAHFVCRIFDWMLNPVLTSLVFISDFFSNLPHSLISSPKPDLFQIFVYYLILLICVLIFQKGFNKKNTLLLVGTTLIFCVSFIKLPGPSELIFFDVQNADCFLYRTRSNKYFIIDTGKQGFNGNKNQVNYIVLEYLKDKGVRNIEGLILTHFDSDHAGGATDILQNLKVKRTYVNSLTDNSAIAKKIYKFQPVSQAKNNEIIYTEPKLTIKTFLAGLEGQKSENENSIITLIDDNGYKILLMGDAGVVGFLRIEKYLPQKIDVLKVGHHGAKGVVDKPMLKRLSPKYSVISTGYNKFGHPNSVIVDILSSSTKLLRTDKNGAIRLSDKKFYVYKNSEGWVASPY